MSNFRAEDESTVYVRAGHSQVFEIQSAPCFGLDSAQSLAIVQPLGTGGSACVGDRVDLVVRGQASASNNLSPCRAQVLRPLTETEVAALPARLRP